MGSAVARATQGQQIARSGCGRRENQIPLRREVVQQRGTLDEVAMIASGQSEEVEEL